MPRGRRARQPIQEAPAYNRPPALTPEAREAEVINAAYDLAEKQLRDGTAAATVITHFLNLASKKTDLERRYLEEKTKLATAKTEAIDRSKEESEFINRVVNAMRGYSGHGDEEEFVDDQQPMYY